MTTIKKSRVKRASAFEPVEFDFKNRKYNVGEVVEKCKTNPKYALWVTNNMADYDIAKMFIIAWDKAMEEKRSEKLRA